MKPQLAEDLLNSGIVGLHFFQVYPNDAMHVWSSSELKLNPIGVVLNVHGSIFPHHYLLDKGSHSMVKVSRDRQDILLHGFVQIFIGHVLTDWHSIDEDVFIVEVLATAFV